MRCDGTGGIEVRPGCRIEDCPLCEGEGQETLGVQLRRALGERVLRWNSEAEVLIDALASEAREAKRLRAAVRAAHEVLLRSDATGLFRDLEVRRALGCPGCGERAIGLRVTCGAEECVVHELSVVLACGHRVGWVQRASCPWCSAGAVVPKWRQP